MELFDSFKALEEALPAERCKALKELSAFTHVLTHKDLHLHPVRVICSKALKFSARGAWFSADDWPALGLPAPVRKLLKHGQGLDL